MRPRRASRLGVCAGLLLLAILACAPTTASTPAAAPAKPAGQAPAQASAPAAAPAAPAGAGAAAWQAEWDRIVAAANQEGRLVVSAPVGDVWRNALNAFQQAYPSIALEMTGFNSRDFWPRLTQERQNGQYLWDLRVGGPDPQVYQARDEGLLDAVRPLLMLPEITDDSKWMGGFDAIFADKERTYLPGFQAFGDTAVWLNKDGIPEGQFRTDRDILNPQWKGKIVLQDPRGGAGLGLTTVLYVKHGEQFIRDLFTQQDVVVTGDNRQQAEWIVRGRYPIGIGVSNDTLIVLEQAGVKARVENVDEGALGMSIGFGGIQLMNRAPNPNAAKLYINWLMTQQGQAQLAETIVTNSRRTDVAIVDPPRAIDQAKLAEYVKHQEEQYLQPRQRVQDLARELLKS